MNNLNEAIRIANDVHFHQFDKAGEAYILHPLRVMMQMQTNEGRILAILHDVIEDSNYEIDDLKDKFSLNILKDLDILTKKKNQSYKEYIENISLSYRENVIKVKLADLKDNINCLRLNEITDKDIERIKKYHWAIGYLGAI